MSIGEKNQAILVQKTPLSGLNPGNFDKVLAQQICDKLPPLVPAISGTQQQKPVILGTWRSDVSAYRLGTCNCGHPAVGRRRRTCNFRFEAEAPCQSSVRKSQFMGYLNPVDFGKIETQLIWAIKVKLEPLSIPERSGIKSS